MRLTTKTRFAITAMLDLAIRGTRGPVTLADISEKQGISLSYLEQLFSALRAKGLVRGVRGPGGGYYLGLDADQITIADIICAVDDWVERTIETIRQKDSVGQPCTTRTLWEDLSQQIFGLVADITLYDLVRRGEMREAGLVQGSPAEATPPALTNLNAASPGYEGRPMGF